MEFEIISDKGQKVSQSLARLQMAAVCERSVDEVLKLAEPINDEIYFVERLRKYKDEILILIKKIATCVEDIEWAEKVL